MEKRCEEVEKSIALNNGIASKQVEEMVRNSVTESFWANPQKQELLRSMPGDSWNLGDGPNCGGGARECRSVSVTCFVSAVVVAVVLSGTWTLTQSLRCLWS
jgi:hypothetical protein